MSALVLMMPFGWRRRPLESWLWLVLGGCPPRKIAHHHRSRHPTSPHAHGLHFFFGRVSVLIMLYLTIYTLNPDAVYCPQRLPNSPARAGQLFLLRHAFLKRNPFHRQPWYLDAVVLLPSSFHVAHISNIITILKYKL